MAYCSSIKIGALKKQDEYVSRSRTHILCNAHVDEPIRVCVRVIKIAHNNLELVKVLADVGQLSTSIGQRSILPGQV